MGMLNKYFQENCNVEDLLSYNCMLLLNFMNIFGSNPIKINPGKILNINFNLKNLKNIN